MKLPSRRRNEYHPSQSTEITPKRRALPVSDRVHCSQRRREGSAVLRETEAGRWPGLWASNKRERRSPAVGEVGRRKLGGVPFGAEPVRGSRLAQKMDPGLALHRIRSCRVSVGDHDCSTSVGASRGAPNNRRRTIGCHPFLTVRSSANRPRRLRASANRFGGNPKLLSRPSSSLGAGFLP